MDKVTGTRGMCIGRYIWLFNSDQYVLQYQPKADSREHTLLILDEGRVEVAAESTREVKPEDVSGLGRAECSWIIRRRRWYSNKVIRCKSGSGVISDLRYFSWQLELLLPRFQ